MPKEIEYKYLLKNEDWKKDVCEVVGIQQGYLNNDRNKTCLKCVKEEGKVKYIVEFRNIDNEVLDDVVLPEKDGRELLLLLVNLTENKLVEGFNYFSLSSSKKIALRVRVKHSSGVSSALVTIKSANKGVIRDEFEYKINLSTAVKMISECGDELTKKRNIVKINNNVWEIDEFEGSNKGLVVAEVELISKDEEFIKPNWLGKDVSDDSRYYNARLVINPYTSWPVL